LGTEFNKKDGLATDPIQSATISGIYNHAKIDVWDNPVKVNVITDGVWGVREKIIATPGAFTSVDNEKANAKKQFSCIVLPQELNKAYFVVTLQTKTGKKYEWSPTENITIESGKKYTLNLSMGDNKLVLSKEGITANAWTNGTGGSLETD
ncbi:fimbrillin family protein, partial [Sinorhizobium sp. GL28]|uniref:fimbrillin family protein n=1 Tax=Sinorhizobium sp. GL28 TaxID=1358418 RepID=UPI0007285056